MQNGRQMHFLKLNLSINLLVLFIAGLPRLSGLKTYREFSHPRQTRRPNQENQPTRAITLVCG
jgi:hypothetical protein